MADMNYDEFDSGDSDFGATFAAAMNWSGAILSVLLIAGLATWGWKLWVRDVSGVPVVQALEGPMRVAPDDPGGVASEYQGLAVNRIAEERIEEGAAERVVLAPAPVAMDAVEDVPVAVETVEVTADPVEAQPLVEVTEAPAFGVGEETAEVVETAPAAPALSATDLAVAQALGGVLEDQVQLNTTLVSANASVVVSTPRPQMRPARSAVVQAVATPASTVQPLATLSTSIPAGTRLVQLGAYTTVEEARAEWDRTQSAFDDYMVGKSRVIQEVQSGGRTFWRLRAHGFEGLSDARRFCAVLIAEGAGCIPVVQS